MILVGPVFPAAARWSASASCCCRLPKPRAATPAAAARTLRKPWVVSCQAGWPSC